MQANLDPIINMLNDIFGDIFDTCALRLRCFRDFVALAGYGASRPEFFDLFSYYFDGFYNQGELIRQQAVMITPLSCRQAHQRGASGSALPQVRHLELLIGQRHRWTRLLLRNRKSHRCLSLRSCATSEEGRVVPRCAAVQ